MKTAKALAAVVFSLFVGTASAQATLDQAMTEAAASIKKTLPQLVDSRTILIDVEYADRNMTYVYITSATKLQLQAIRSAVQKDSTEYNCASRLIYSTLTGGVTYRYIYLDSNGDPGIAFSVSRKSCGPVM
jgi:hypothetical protein